MYLSLFITYKFNYQYLFLISVFRSSQCLLISALNSTNIIFYMYHIIICKASLLLYIFLTFHLSEFQKSVTLYTYFTIDDFYRSNIDFLIYLFNLSVCFHLPMIVLSILFLRCFLCFSPNTTSSKLKKTSLKPEYTAHYSPLYNIGRGI